MLEKCNKSVDGILLPFKHSFIDKRSQNYYQIMRGIIDSNPELREEENRNLLLEVSEKVQVKLGENSKNPELIFSSMLYRK